MNGRALDSDTFVRRVHWRYVMLHLVERAGLGTLFGCAAALPLVGILLWRGMPAVAVSLMALAIGMAAGLLWGVLTRPSRIAAAMEADRQFGWADLLSSAILVQSKAIDDPWAAAVRVAADTRCRGVSPSGVLLHRLGARAWGGIGLATALVLALGMIPTFAEPTRAGGRQNAGANPLAALAGETQSANVGSGTVPRRSAVQQEPEDPNSSRMNGIEPPPQRVEKAHSDGNVGNLQRATATDSSGRGTGASQSNTENPPSRLADVSGTGAKDISDRGKVASGAGQASAQGAAKGEAAGQSAGASNQARQPVPPWQSSQWAGDSQRANEAVENGRIPDSYRDVIRGYFEPP